MTGPVSSFSHAAMAAVVKQNAIEFFARPAGKLRQITMPVVRGRLLTRGTDDCGAHHSDGGVIRADGTSRLHRGVEVDQ